MMLKSIKERQGHQEARNDITKIMGFPGQSKNFSSIRETDTIKILGNPQGKQTNQPKYSNKSKLIISIIGLLILWGVRPIYAGKGYIIKFKAEGNVTLIVTPESCNNWDPNGMGATFTVDPNQMSDGVYTEAKETFFKGCVLTFLIKRINCLSGKTETFKFQLEHNGGFDAGITDTWALSPNNSIGLMLKFREPLTRYWWKRVDEKYKAYDFGIKVQYEGTNYKNIDFIRISVECKRPKDCT